MNNEGKAKLTFAQKYPALKDIFNFLTFIGAVVLGTFILNTFIFRSYNVVGSSMENTLQNSDRVIVNRVPVSIAHLQEHAYVPKRGQVIVFANGGSGATMSCEPQENIKDEYIIKRVIAFPGERVVVENGKLTVYNNENPDGFSPDLETHKSDTDGPKEFTSGTVNTIVPDGEIFVSGDNREGKNSYDSRNGLGTVPYCRIIGPVIFRLAPFNKFRTFSFILNGIEF